ncbi:MAG: hypothetical protein F6K22_00180 [Okeania sp. SIO2F4]|uniref:hypothetical protein n=1 Tax=Okeania sp. SIO2F4 TaxID=2607790 RepID=UPI00142C83B6|nr:hypothetical protein [Okeania sp. SIO2F4]NES01400.1 hypothetical protein [Okeania sp. SIO2F4]
MCECSFLLNLLVHKPGVDISREMFGASGCFNHETQTLATAKLWPNFSPMERIYATDIEL